MQDRERRTYDALGELGVEYELFEHEPMMTVDAAVDLDKKMGLNICKNLFLSSRHGSEFFLLLMPGAKKFNTGKVSKQLGVPRMTFASDEFMLEFLDILPGSVSPLGLLNDKENKVKFLIDSDVMKEEKIAVHPCVNTATVIISVRDLIDKILVGCKHDFTIVEI